MNTRIKQLRITLKLTLKDFGERLGLRPSTISDIEHNRCNINDRLIISICSRYNVNEEWLRSGKGTMFNSHDKKFDEFYEIYSHLKPQLQDFLIESANLLLKKQDLL